MSSIATARLTQERKNWRKSHPVDFYARPEKKADNSLNLMVWEAGIPGKEKTDWAGGMYKVKMEFPNEYPSKPPKCSFVPPLYHVNVYNCGEICLSILNPDAGWKPGITIEQMLLGIQDLLTNPNPQSAAQQKAFDDYTSNRSTYNKTVRDQAKKRIPDTGV
jgi:ubiquitin-conjugating enzyme E2 I